MSRRPDGADRRGRGRIMLRSNSALLILLVSTVLVGACASSPPPGVRRSQIRDCPVGMVLICESGKPQEPASAGDEEIPEFDRCYCEYVRQ